MNQPRRDWNLIVTIIIGVISMIPGYYVFIEDKFPTKSTPSSQEKRVEYDSIRW